MAVKNYGIHDKWTDLDKLNNVDIKSVDGVIESVKINGEEAGGGGSSDFSTATMTLDTGDRFKVAGAFITPDGTTTFGGTNFADGDYQLILYKGTGEVFMENWDSELFAITGNITMPLPATGVVTGDFKISYIGE